MTDHHTASFRKAPMCRLLVTALRYLCLPAGILLLHAGCDTTFLPPELPGRSAIIYTADGSTPADGAAVRLFTEDASGDRPAAVYFTNKNGYFSLGEVPDGIYSVWVTLDSLVARQDSVLITPARATLHDDTLECPSTLTGAIAIKPEHDSRTVMLRVLGSDRSIDVTDIAGTFTLTGLAKGDYTLLLTCSLEDYRPSYFPVSVAGCSGDTLRDTLRADAAGMPIVTGIHISQDTLIGTITITWNTTLHRDVLDYLIYRKDCDAKDFTFTPLHATNDTVFIDSLYVPLAADLADSTERCLRYWIALRSNSTDPGPAYRYSAWRFAPKSYIMTALSHHIYNGELEGDSASVNDTLRLCVTAENRTRPVRSITWYDPVDNETIMTASNPDSLSTELSDTLIFSFDTLGRNTVWAIAEDNAGVRDTETVTITIVPDIPVADAGADTGVFTGEKAFLHGSAEQSFGAIVSWKWKVGGGEWVETSGPDTTVTAPQTEAAVICSLAVTDEDGNTSRDAMTFYTSQKIIAVAAGAAHNLLIKADRTAWACGVNGSGQLGNPGSYSEISPVDLIGDVGSIAAGGGHSLFLKTDGSLWTCGSNESGQLGDGTTVDKPVPVKIMDDVKSIAAGRLHSLVVKKDNSLWAFGANDSGQLGDGTGIGSSRPVQVMNNVQRVAAGWYHTLILGTDGTLRACGDNNSGKLGDESIEDKKTPVRIMDDVQDIAASERHSLILKTDGTLWTCGNNWVGQLGDSTGGRWVKPQQVFSDVQRIAAGRDFTLILKNDGTLWGCGANQFGQLGDGSTDDRFKPVYISDKVQAMAAGDYHMLLLKTDGSLWVCGDNYYGQLCCTAVPVRKGPFRIVPFMGSGEDE